MTEKIIDRLYPPSEHSLWVIIYSEKNSPRMNQLDLPQPQPLVYQLPQVTEETNYRYYKSTGTR